jgi:DNA-binding NtrC family response regulator
MKTVRHNIILQGIAPSSRAAQAEGLPQMPVQIVLVHDDAAFRTTAAQALGAEGYSVTSFADALAATAALAMANRIELLITRLQFAEGRSNGVALALMTKRRKPGVKVIFTGLPELKGHSADVGLFLEMPVALDDLVNTVRQELS